MYRLSIILGLFTYLVVVGQSALTSGYFDYPLIDRYEILSDSLDTDVFTAFKPYRRDHIASYSNNINPISGQDAFNKDYLLGDNMLYSNAASGYTNSPLFKHFFKTKNAGLFINEKGFKAIINPVLGFSGGIDSEDSVNLYQNSRGLELRGSIGNKIGFYSYVLENQVRYPSYLRDKHLETGVINGTTLHKQFGEQAEDFFNVAGYITFSPIEEINVQFGHDKNFIGNGYRSLILSDLSAPYPFLKLSTKVWKFQYQNLYSQHIDFVQQGESANNGRKFSALHHLSINLGKNLNIGFFENIIFDRSDSNETNSYEVAYLNPIIFYRAVEHGLNSSDNASLGMDWKWNFKNHFSFYGQFILDEFVKDELFGRTESWVNKWAYQAGIKYINVANINNLDLQLEVNQLRPYLNQHRTKSQNWVHYNQSLAHPLGTNLRELVGILRYQPLNKLKLTAVYSFSKQGKDSSNSTTNYGGDYLRSYYNRTKEDVHPMFLGIENTISTISLDASYMLWHNLFLDAGIVLRTETNQLWISDRINTIVHFGLRLNTRAFDYRQ